MSGESRAWEDADFANPETDVYSPERLKRRQWMGHVEKQPFAPWGDRDHPDCPTGEDARWKWSITENYTDGETIAIAEDDHRLDGRVFLQQTDGPYAYVDADNAVCPETGEVHPKALETVAQLGLSYADISQSDSGFHVSYRGDLPEEVKEPEWQLDDEPWGANDEPPTIEIYARKRVCVDTGKHVPGTPLDVRSWDHDALEALIDEHVPEADRHTTTSHDTDADPLEDYEPTVTGAHETTGEIRDVYAAVDALRPGDLPLRTSKVGEESGPDGWEKWDPSSYRSSSGGDSLHRPPGESKFYDQKTGHAFGLLALFAAEQDVISKPWHDLSGATWFEAVDAARDAGAPIPVFDGSTQSEDAERVVVMPNAPVEIADRNAREWSWREAAEQQGREIDDGDELSIDSARRRTREAIANAYRYGDRVLVDALPTLGKSYGTIAAAADTGELVSYLTNRGNDEQYERARERCEKFGLSYYTLPSAWRNCPCFRGDHGEDVAADVQQAYNNGATAKEIHIRARDYLGYELPCQHEDEGGCEWQAKWGFDPDDYDVLIGHYSHAHVNSVVTSRTVAFDEFPGGSFETTLDESLAGVVSHFLSHTPALDIEDYTDLMVAREDEQRRADALGWFMQSQQPGRDPGLAFAESGHALAPLATFTLLAAAKNDLGNGWERAGLEDVGGEGWVGLHDREQGKIHILRPPSFNYSSSLVALDGTPTRRLWKLALGLKRLNTRQVLTEDERVEYLRDVLEHRYVRTTDWIKPYSSGENVNARDDTVLLEWIRERYDRTPALITSRNAKFAYHDDEELGFRLALDEHGQLDPNRIVKAESCVSAAKHYGNLLGSGDFETERLGVVIGSRHFGDEFVKKWTAYAGEATERVDKSENGKGTDLQYTGLGDAIHRHMTENQTLQAAMRFGRDGNGALTFVHTNTLPEWVDPVVVTEGRLVTAWSEGMKDVLDVAKGLDEWGTIEIAEHPDVGIGERQVRDHLYTLEKRGFVSSEVEGDGFVWRDDGLHRVCESGDVELQPVEIDELDDEETAELTRSRVYRWKFRTRPHTSSTSSPLTESIEPNIQTDETHPDKTEPPPDEAD